MFAIIRKFMVSVRRTGTFLVYIYIYIYIWTDRRGGTSDCVLLFA